MENPRLILSSSPIGRFVILPQSLIPRRALPVAQYSWETTCHKANPHIPAGPLATEANLHGFSEWQPEWMVGGTKVPPGTLHRSFPGIKSCAQSNLDPISNRATVDAMRFLPSVVVLLLTLTGCVNRATSPASHLVIPRSCITDLRFSKKAVCRPLPNGLFSCDGIVLQAACVKAKQ